jgi:hypothetical protein
MKIPRDIKRSEKLKVGKEVEKYLQSNSQITKYWATRNLLNIGVKFRFTADGSLSNISLMFSLWKLWCVSLRSEFRVVLSVTISAYQRCSVRLYLQLFVGWSMSYSRDLCLFTHSGVQHILCFVFVLFSLSCVSCVASLSRLYFCDLRFRSSLTSCVPYVVSLSRLHFCDLRFRSSLTFM